MLANTDFLSSLYSYKSQDPTRTNTLNSGNLDSILPSIDFSFSNLLGSSVDYSQEVVLVLDPEFKVAGINNASLSEWGYPPSDLISKHFHDLVHADDRAETVRKLGLVKSERMEAKFESRVIKCDGAIADTMWSCKYSESDNLYICFVIDISERKELEREKQSIIEMRQAFMAMVSHDMRAPLNSFLMFLTMMEEGIYGELNERGKNRIAGIEDTLRRLAQLINDLLDLDKIDSGRLSTKSVGVSVLCKRATESIQELAHGNNVSLESNFESGSVEVDEDRIVQVLVNFLSNAIEFSPDGGKVKVDIYSVDDETVFTVSDEGCGIPENKRDKVFERFEQLKDKENANRKGSGLGLAIAKAIVELHGGRIGVNSEEGSGSTFWFTIPHVNGDGAYFPI